MRWKSRGGGSLRFETTLPVVPWWHLGASNNQGVKNMFWKFLALGVLGLFFIKFGMMAAVVPLLSIGLQVSLLIVVGLVFILIYKTMQKRI